MQMGQSPSIGLRLEGDDPSAALEAGLEVDSGVTGALAKMVVSSVERKASW